MIPPISPLTTTKRASHLLAAAATGAFLLLATPGFAQDASPAPPARRALENALGTDQGRRLGHVPDRPLLDRDALLDRRRNHSHQPQESRAARAGRGGQDSLSAGRLRRGLQLLQNKCLAPDECAAGRSWSAWGRKASLRGGDGRGVSERELAHANLHQLPLGYRCLRADDRFVRYGYRA